MKFTEFISPQCLPSRGRCGNMNTNFKAQSPGRRLREEKGKEKNTSYGVLPMLRILRVKKNKLQNTSRGVLLMPAIIQVTCKAICKLPLRGY